MEVARSAAEAAGSAGGSAGGAPQVDLSPVMEKLAETLRALADRKMELQIPPDAISGPMVPPLPMSASPGDEAAGQPAGEGGQPMGPPGFAHQLRLIQDALMPLRQLSRRQIKDGEGKVSAMHVWRQVNEALQIVQAAAFWR